MSIRKVDHPHLREVPGGIEALADFFVPRSGNIILASQTMVDAVLGLQVLSKELYQEYCKLYQVDPKTAEVPTLSPAEHAGFDMLAGSRPEILQIASGVRSLGKNVYKRDITSIQGVDKNPFLLLLEKYLEIRVGLFEARNRKALQKPLNGFANPEITFQREQELYAKNIQARLTEFLDTTNPFIRTYPEFLDEIEKAIWHEMLFFANIINDDDLIGNSFLPFNYTEDNQTTGYLVGEEKLTRMISKFRRGYFNQFLIHRNFTAKAEGIFRASMQ